VFAFLGLFCLIAQDRRMLEGSTDLCIGGGFGSLIEAGPNANACGRSGFEELEMKNRRATTDL
jgi:hypothetical protein